MHLIDHVCRPLARQTVPLSLFVYIKLMVCYGSVSHVRATPSIPILVVYIQYDLSAFIIQYTANASS